MSTTHYWCKCKAQSFDAWIRWLPVLKQCCLRSKLVTVETKVSKYCHIRCDTKCVTTSECKQKPEFLQIKLSSGIFWRRTRIPWAQRSWMAACLRQVRAAAESLLCSMDLLCWLLPISGDGSLVAEMFWFRVHLRHIWTSFDHRYAVDCC